MKIKVELAIATTYHTWDTIHYEVDIPDVDWEAASGAEREALIEEAAAKQFEEDHDEEVAFFKVYFWEYPEETDEEEDSEHL